MGKTIQAVVFGSLLLTGLISTAHATDIISLDPGATSISGVNIPKGATVTVEGRQSNLTTYGAGVRTHFFDIYVGQLLVTDPSKFVAKNPGALDSLPALGTVAFKIDFIFTFGVSASQLSDALDDGFAANNIDESDPNITLFMNAIKAGGTGSKGSSMLVVGEYLANNVEAITLQDPEGKLTTIKGGKGFIAQIMSLWLGNPGDNDVQKMQDKIFARNIQ